MLKESGRKLGAAMLLAAVWFGAVAAVPMSAMGQATEDKKPSTEQTARQDEKIKNSELCGRS